MESWGVTKDDAIWATEDEYSRWNKKTRLNSNSTSNSNSNSTSKAIGRMFYKTKLCCKYRSGTCPYVTNCNFAHGLDELRNPPENWQEIVAAHDEEQHQNQSHNNNNNNSNNHSEQHLQQIPIISTTESRGESHHSQRSYKGRHCKKFYTQEGCPYGDSCTFLHDEQSRSRESVAISVTPALAPPPSAVAVGVGSSSSSLSVNVNSVKPSNWKTRICNKWETTGTCPFGPKCHFAHGWPELHNFGGGTTEGDCRESSAATETKTSAGMAIKTDAAPTATLEHHHHNHHHVGGGITSQRPSMVIKVVGRRPLPKWKGPDKISRIYGDWIGDIE